MSTGHVSRARLRTIVTVVALTLFGTSCASTSAANALAPSCETTASNFADLQAAVSQTGSHSACLGADLSVPGNAHLALDPSGAIKLDLAGHTLSISADPTHAAIEIPNGSDLTIDATGGGSLTALGPTQAPGIGSVNSPSGHLTINGGTITAIGGMSSAGIGGGYGQPGATVTINGGTVRATGGPYASAIGGGDGGFGNPDGGIVVITGGIVRARAGQLASGIGGGVYGDGGSVTISGGDVIATGGCEGSAIGAGAQGTNGGTLTITGTGTTTSRGRGLNLAPCHARTFTGGPVAFVTTISGRGYFVHTAANETTQSFATMRIRYVSSLPDTGLSLTATGITGLSLSLGGCVLVALSAWRRRRKRY